MTYSEFFSKLDRCRITPSDIDCAESVGCDSSTLAGMRHSFSWGQLWDKEPRWYVQCYYRGVVPLIVAESVRNSIEDSFDLIYGGGGPRVWQKACIESPELAHATEYQDLRKLFGYAAKVV
jgi:hypothetical protein